MISPIERIPNNDKTVMPLRGEGNQPTKQPHDINISIHGDGAMSANEIIAMIESLQYAKWPLI